MKYETRRRVGAAYRVIKPSHEFNEGEIIYLIDNDGSDLPWFSYLKKTNGHDFCHPMYMDYVEFLGDFNSLPVGTKLYKKNDGSEIEIESISVYVASGELLSAKHLECSYTFEKPTVKEITMQEIADKFRIDINDLRIKE